MAYFHLSHSGARIWREGNRVYKVGGPRLRIAAEKQSKHSSAWLSAPKVLEVTGEQDVTLVQEWVDGRLPLAVPRDAAMATGAAAAYVLGGQGRGQVPVGPMVERLAGIACCPTLRRAVADQLTRLQCLPAGRTHGDLTFCNMLVSGATTYAVDFSDVTVESPLLDAVKLLQDVHHGWAARLTEVSDEAATCANARLQEIFAIALRGYTRCWRPVSAWSLLCRVFAYGNAATKTWAEQEASRCIQCC